MKKILIILCIGLTCSLFAQQQPPKGKLFIIGGGSRPSGMVDRIIKESGIDKSGYGIILPMSSIEPDSAVYYATRQFYDKGITNVHGLNFVKGEISSPTKLDSISKAKLIYISGGDQNRFMDVIAGTPIEKSIHKAYENGSLIAGTSAGAAVMSRMMITGNELKHPEYSSTFRYIQADNIEIKPGLGMLTNVIIDQHFVKRSRYNRLLSAVIQYPEMMGIGIDEATAILVDGNSVEVVGVSQVVVMENRGLSTNKFEDKLGAHGMELNVFLPGDTFQID
ncbi:cyanophycinase [Flagellimonas iocasae]|uniref:Cyanophycinase n=1 Tax=Flagellimonas iocasae TaxID=2055905 RepID=A0ABW4Y3N7_9FLAO